MTVLARTSRNLLDRLTGNYIRIRIIKCIWMVFHNVAYCNRPPLWSSGQSSWLQTQMYRFRLPALPDFLRNSGERDPLTLVSTIEEVLGRNSSGSGLETREYGRRDPLIWPRDTHPQKLALTSPTYGGHSVGIVCPYCNTYHYQSFQFCNFAP
jgi:hypothetical protein